MSVCNFTFVNNTWTSHTLCPTNLYCPIRFTDCDTEPCTSLCEEYKCTYKYDGKYWESVTNNCNDQDTFWTDYYCTTDSCNTKFKTDFCRDHCRDRMPTFLVISLVILIIVSFFILFEYTETDKPRSSVSKYLANIEVFVFWIATIGLVIGLLDSDNSTWAVITLVFTILMGIVPMLKFVPMLKSYFNKKQLSVVHIITSLVVLLGLTLMFGKSFEKEVAYANLAFLAVISFVFSISASHYAYIEEKANNEKVNICKVYIFALLTVIIPILGFAFYDWLGYVLFTVVALFLAYVHKGVLLKTDANAATGGIEKGGEWRQLRVIYR